MQLAIPAQERPARKALTVEVNCVNRTRKRVPDAARFSAGPAFIPSSAALEAIVEKGESAEVRNASEWR